ncbi:hypothetical protein QTL91_09370, partial [Salmonella enterica subsp. enterica serovar Typhimurium]|uniref:hypothetical protein n=1 Tax=Salmonella enterica TaxID=28901 RepID=UPI00262FF7C5
GPVFHTIVSIKNDGHYFCRAGGNRPDGLNEPVTIIISGKVQIPFLPLPEMVVMDTEKRQRLITG